MTAMTWKAFNHGYQSAIALVAPHALQHLLDMRDRRRRQDAVSKIEDQTAIAEVAQDRVDRPIERNAAGKQGERIEIALNRHPALHALADELPIRHPVDADRIDRHAIHIITKQM